MQTQITNKLLKNLENALVYNLKNKYDIDDRDKIDNFLKLHGIHKDNFDYVKTIETIVNTTLNDISIDSNSNKNEKTVEAITQESVSSVRKILGFDYLYKTMKENYGKIEAKRLMGEILDYSLGLSDSTNILKPYCFSINASDIVTEGRNFGQLYSKPSKRVSSYISALCETVHQISSHLAGAVAIGTFFLDISHLLLYKEKIDLRDIKTNKNIRKKVENEFQQFVHSVNHLSRNGVESPFTNLSIFDKSKLKTLIHDMNWYFPIDTLPIDLEDFEDESEKKEYYDKYIIDFIMEVQKIFINFFNLGDPTKNGMPYRFPIITLNISKKVKGDDFIFEDPEFIKMVCKLDIYRYNIFVSSGTKLASCCRLINDTNLIEYASQSNSFGGAGISIGSHRVCTVNFNRIFNETESLEDFYKKLEERTESVAKILSSHKQLIATLEKKGLQPFITNKWLNMDRMFSTFGILGIYEAATGLSQKYKIKDDITKEILVFFNAKVLEYSKKYFITGNIEQIPGESFSIRLAKSDKIIYGEDKIPYVLYANQFVPLWEKNTTLWEKMRQDGSYNKLITGGGIVHCTIGEKVTSKQAEKIIRFSMNSGCEHFALNAIYNECINKHVTMGSFDVCPICSSEIIEKLTRVVGFFTPVSSWQKERRDWEFPKRHIHDLKNELEKE
jgi:ribonucleoside-triphosphate reductase